MPEGRLPRDEMIAARLAGASIVDISRQFGCSVGGAGKVLRGIPSPIDHIAEAARRNIALATHVRMQKAQSPGGAGVGPRKREPKQLPGAIPRWVAEAGLAQDYRDFRAAFNEHHAARECRRLKAEALQ